MTCWDANNGIVITQLLAYPHLKKIKPKAYVLILISSTFSGCLFPCSVSVALAAAVLKITVKLIHCMGLNKGEGM